MLGCTLIYASDDFSWGHWRVVFAWAMARAPRRAARTTCVRCRWYIGAQSAWYVVYVAREDLSFALRRRSIQLEGSWARTSSWAAMRRISGKPSSRLLPNVTSSHSVLGSLWPFSPSDIRFVLVLVENDCSRLSRLRIEIDYVTLVGHIFTYALCMCECVHAWRITCVYAGCYVLLYFYNLMSKRNTLCYLIDSE